MWKNTVSGLFIAKLARYDPWVSFASSAVVKFSILLYVCSLSINLSNPLVTNFFYFAILQWRQNDPVMFYDGDVPEASTVLPPGDPKDNYYIKVSVRIADQYGDFALYHEKVKVCE